MTLPAPTPRSWDPGDIGSAPYLNENVRDAFNFLTSPPIFVGQQLTAQSIPNNTLPMAPLAFDLPVVDTYNAHSVANNPSRFVCPFFGIWLVYGFVCFNSNATGRRLSQLWQNGVSQVQTEVMPAATPGNTDVWNWWAGPGSAGDYFELAAFQSSGAALLTNVSPLANSSTLHVALIGGHL